LELFVVRTFLTGRDVQNYAFDVQHPLHSDRAPNRFPAANINNDNTFMRGSDAPEIFMPPGKSCFALLMRHEPLVEPNVLDTFLQPSIV
jgi:hypothetical protein